VVPNAVLYMQQKRRFVAKSVDLLNSWAVITTSTWEATRTASTWHSTTGHSTWHATLAACAIKLGHNRHGYAFELIDR